MSEITEWTFAADAAKWMVLHLQRHRNLPFVEAKVEIKGRGDSRRKDLVLYDRDGRKALTAEIKLPDTKEGQTPYHAGLVTDARRKAVQSQAPFFATWNVNRLVLWATEAEHELKPYDAIKIRHRAELMTAPVQRRLREEFIPRFLEDFARIYRGEETLGVRPLDQRFISRLESALESLANVLFTEALERYLGNRPFKQSLDTWMREQGWLISDEETSVRDNVERAIRLAGYITANKLVFYQALRRTRSFKLPELDVPAHIDSGERLRDHFASLFHEAKVVTHDYQTIFEGGFIDRVLFIADPAVDRWRALVRLLNEFDFRQFDQDLVGHIFEDLLGPEERHRWGQHYTKPEIVDVINAFCIREPGAVVLDPASGSGTFPVRAYARKKHLARGALTHANLLGQLYACEISEYAAHLTALNLATRDLIDGENFPRVARSDFFDTTPGKPFCSVPDALSERKKRADVAMRDIFLDKVHAVVGNPPYLEQNQIGRANKLNYPRRIAEAWPDLKLSGRSDLHVYFWPHAAALLAEGGYFGFLTSSPWLDAEYGFHLQRWVLQNFELVAILESICEPWFTGARVATAATILRRCSDATRRAQNLVRFVQLRKPLKELLANDGTETGRQEAADHWRDLIEATTADTRTAAYRILVVPQQKLWHDGCQLGDLNSCDESDEPTQVQQTNGMLHDVGGAYGGSGEYHGGKWGIYLRAPDLFFDITTRYGNAFAPFGRMAEVRYAVKSGCDGFFFPRDVTALALSAETNPVAFRHRYRCSRRHLESGKVAVVRAGDESEHPIETKFLQVVFVPEDDIKNILLRAEQNRHRILWLNQPKSELRTTHVLEYLKYGQHETFGEGQVVPEKPSCKSRPTHWYDLTPSVGTRLLMPKGQQYGNIVFYAPVPFLCNSRVYNLGALTPDLEKAFAAILNSTLVALWRCLYGRALGREGAADIMVVDVKMMPVPDARTASPEVLLRLERALDAMGQRQILPFLETAFAHCDNSKDALAMANAPVVLPPELVAEDRRELDDAVLELIRVASANERKILRERLYEEIVRFYRQVRILELQAVENRRRAKRGRTSSAHEVAAEIFDSADPSLFRRFPADFLPSGEPLDTVELPEGKTSLFDRDDLYDSKSMLVGPQKLTFRHRAQVELAKLHCDLERRGFVQLPVSEESCGYMSQMWAGYLRNMLEGFKPLAVERTEDADRLEAILAELKRLLETR